MPCLQISPVCQPLLCSVIRMVLTSHFQSGLKSDLFMRKKNLRIHFTRYSSPWINCNKSRADIAFRLRDNFVTGIVIGIVIGLKTGYIKNTLIPAFCQLKPVSGMSFSIIFPHKKTRTPAVFVNLCKFRVSLYYICQPIFILMKTTFEMPRSPLFPVALLSQSRFPLDQNRLDDLVDRFLGWIRTALAHLSHFFT